MQLQIVEGFTEAKHILNATLRFCSIYDCFLSNRSPFVSNTQAKLDWHLLPVFFAFGGPLLISIIRTNSQIIRICLVLLLMFWDKKDPLICKRIMLLYM